MPSPVPSSRSRGFLIARSLVAIVLLALLGSAEFAAGHPLVAQAGGPAAGLKAVFIVGPAAYNTSEYIAQANGMADEAAAEGMQVVKIYTPNAYWSTVKEKAQGANLLVYFGHGNGFPNPYRSVLYEDSEDGFGLNPEGSPHHASFPTEYHGANEVRRAIDLAKNAVVVLYRLCYASGNAESGMRAMDPSSKQDRNTAYQRVDNFAAGFLKIGAGVVFAWGWPQKINLPKQLAETNRSMDKIFEDKANDTGSPNAFIGTHDYRVPSTRTDGAWLHLDPHPVYGYLRALTGNLDMTTGAWRGEDVADHTAPAISAVSAGVGSATLGEADGSIAFSPNGDGVDDQLTIQRTLSESGTLRTTVAAAAADPKAAPLLTLNDSANSGAGTTTWDGRDANGDRVPDGEYTLTLTPIDRAGNVGGGAVVHAWVLDALRSPGASVPAIEVRDGDVLGTSVRFNATLDQVADITWQVLDRAGNVVVAADPQPAVDPSNGELLFTWDGLDTLGNPVADGMYRGVVTATTPAGTISYAMPVYVGPFQFGLSVANLKAGHRVKLTVYNTEPLHGRLRVTVTQKGLAPYTLTLTKAAGTDYRYTAMITLKPSSTKGLSSWTLTATDKDGGAESMTFTRRVR